MEGLKSQLNDRLLSGQGSAVYWVGVRDDGIKVGLTEHLLQSSVDSLGVLAQELGAKIASIYQEDVTNNNAQIQMHQRLRKLIDMSPGKPRWVARINISRPSPRYPPIFLDV
jgi:GTPase